MGRINSGEAEREAARQVANLMVSAARTAPKARGVDSIKTLIVDGEDLNVLAEAMEGRAGQKAQPTAGAFTRDAKNVKNSAAVVLIGVTGEPKKPDQPLNCGGCGYPSCTEFMADDKRRGEDFRGPLCVFQTLDLGIALGSAAKMASELNIDNRMMYTIGAAARDLGWLDCDVVVGFPLSISGKSPYFDR